MVTSGSIRMTGKHSCIIVHKSTSLCTTYSVFQIWCG